MTGPKEKGWYLVCVDGYPLGFGKLSGGTLKINICRDGDGCHHDAAGSNSDGNGSRQPSGSEKTDPDRAGPCKRSDCQKTGDQG